MVEIEENVYIPVKKSTREKLKKKRITLRESFDEIINRLIKW